MRLSYPRPNTIGIKKVNDTFAFIEKYTTFEMKDVFLKQR